MKLKLKTTLIRLLTIALVSRFSEQGFAMVVAVALGLVMVLVGSMMIIRSQGDRQISSAQAATDGASIAAETGINRYVTLLNNARDIVLYPSCQNPNLTNGTCNDTSTTKSWVQSVNIPLSRCSGSGGISSTAIANAAATGWQDIDYNNPTKGQYRLVSYTYGLIIGKAPGTGTLIVEGRVNQNGTGSAAQQTAGTATTRLQVNIPVSPRKFYPFPFPGMWVATSVSTGNTAANVMGPCGTTWNGSFVSHNPPYQYTTTNLKIPSPPPIPSPTLVAGVVPSSPPLPSNQNKYVKTIPDPGGSGFTINTIYANASGIATLPLDTDIVQHEQDLNSNPVNKNNPNSNFNWTTGEYQYVIPSITGNINILPSQFLTANFPTMKAATPGQPPIKVAIYLTGNISMTGGQDKVIHCTNPGNFTQIANCNATDARVYGEAASGSASFSLAGNASVCAIFFFAPTYDVILNGGGQAQGCGGGPNNNGIYWVHSWSGGGQGNQTSIGESGSSWNDVASLINIPFSPQIDRATSWQRQPAHFP